MGRPKQQPPPGSWTYWFLRCGRGFGKTLSVAQWAKERALERPVRFALVGPTFADVRDTMVEGETGLLSVLPNEALRGGSRDRAWNRSIGELYLANGTVFKSFFSEKPDRIRGPQNHYAWCEEVSSWKDANVDPNKPETTWSQVKLSTRLGERGYDPQIAITSTPKNNRLTLHLASIPAPRMRMVIGSSYENRANLAESWWQEVVAPLEGTRTGRQEILAEILTDIEGALWTRALLEDLRVDYAPELSQVVVAVDPNASSSEASNEAGIIVVGRARYPEADGYRHGYVIGDRTPDHGGPAVWAQAAVDAYREFEADCIVGEQNNGGEMVELVIKAVDPDVPVERVSAARGKRTRAEPVSALYTGSRAPDGSIVIPPTMHHVRNSPAGREDFKDLEDQMTTWTPEAESPDRMDALVWGATRVMLGEGGPIRMRTYRTRGRIPTAADRFVSMG